MDFPTWPEMQQFVMTAGLAVFIVVFLMIMGTGGTILASRAVWNFLKPLIQEAFRKHFNLIDTLTARASRDESQHIQTMRSFRHLGNATLAASPPERQDIVKPYITSLHEETHVKES